MEKNNTSYNYQESVDIKEQQNTEIELLIAHLEEEKSVKIDTIIGLSQILKDWLINEFYIHTVDKWENLWRIIYNRTWFSISDQNIQEVKIKVWDEVIFVNDYIILRDKSWVYFRMKINKYEQFNVKKNKVQVKKEIENKISKKSEKKENIETDSEELEYENFLKLSVEERFKLVTIPSNNWYLKINFPNKTLASKVSINDIIPEEYKYCHVVRDREIKIKWWEKVEKNYFDIAQRNSNNQFESIFEWKQYDKIIINNWFLIKPTNYEINYDIKTIYNKDDNDVSKQNVANNEIIIRNIYWELINEITSKIKQPTSINSDFVYAIIAEESKFNPNAISYTWVRGLWQIQEATLADILIRNKNWRLDEQIKNWENLEDIFLYNDQLIETKRELIVTNNKWKINYSWVDTELYHPEISIKSTINYLLFLESLFDDVKNLTLRRHLIAASYNMWATWLKNLIKDFWKKPKSLRELIWILKHNEEPRNYVARVNNYYNKQKKL